MESNDFGRLIPKKFVPCFEGCTYNTTLPVPKKLDSCKSLHSNQQLMWAKDKIVDDSNLNEESSNGDMELDSQPNKGEDFPDQKNPLFGRGNASLGVPITKLQLKFHLNFHAYQSVHLRSIVLWIHTHTRNNC